MTTYALFVGIDAYQGGVSPLRGCVADARAMRTTILERQPDALVRLLLDEEATREQFITVFDTHFAPAADGDTAIIWYSGHGSQSPTAAGTDLEPDGLDETLVFVDSRLPGRRDLLDKELGTLISGVAKRGVRVVVGLDACHSGSGTREELPDGTLVRRTSADTRVVVRHEGRPGLAGAPPDSTGWDLSGPHVLLAACRSDQTAKERPIGNEPRGVFTAAVERALRTRGASTYRELLPLIRDAVVAAGISDQVPQFEAIGSTDTDTAFLGAGGAADFVVAFDSAHRCWTLDAGAIHGIPSAVDGSTRIQARNDDLDASALAVLTPTQVDPHRTLLRVVEGELQPGRAYPARIVGWSLPRLGVAVPDEDAELRRAIATSVLLHTDPLGPLRVSVDHGSYSIVDGLAGAQEVLSVPAGLLAVPSAVDALERIARWHNLEALTNPSAGAVANAVTLQVRGSMALSTGPGEVTLPYATDQRGESVPQRVDFVLRNTSDRRVYCGLFNLGSSYSVSPMLAAHVVALDPGQETVRSGRAFIPENEAAAGVTRKSETLKLIVSTEQFESFPIVQRRLDAGVSRDDDAIAGQLATPAANTLAGLLRSARTRDYDFDDALAVDWATETVRTVIERPLPRVPLRGSTPLAPGVRVTAPAGLGGTARLVSSATIARNLTAPLTPPLLLDSPQSWAPFSLRPVRDAAPLDVLELADDLDVTAVTPATPLTVEFDQDLDGDHVVVIAFDGTDYLPVGFVDRRRSVPDQQATRVRITSIPAPITDKSLVGSVRLLFRRFWGKLTGRGSDQVRLATPRIIHRGEGRSVHYDDGEAGLRTAVASAQRVLLIVHGIIGDTEGMVLGCDDIGILSGYDLVLTFDYESINTPIEDTARLLRDRLAAVGLTQSGPPIDILAHSMGGLVSRWMLEVLADPPNVARLVTAGTPNDGSPWATIANWTTVILGLGLNQLATVFWPAKLVGWLIAAIEKIDHAFDQLAPDSPFLESLAAAEDPGIRYFVVLGDRSAASSAERRNQFLGKILHGTVDLATALAFMRETNDLAVSETSGLTIPIPRVPPAESQTGVACDHLTYFSAPEGQAALVRALTQDASGNRV